MIKKTPFMETFPHQTLESYLQSLGVSAVELRDSERFVCRPGYWTDTLRGSQDGWIPSSAVTHRYPEVVAYLAEDGRAVVGSEGVYDPTAAALALELVDAEEARETKERWERERRMAEGRYVAACEAWLAELREEPAARCLPFEFWQELLGRDPEEFTDMECHVRALAEAWPEAEALLAREQAGVVYVNLFTYYKQAGAAVVRPDGSLRAADFRLLKGRGEGWRLVGAGELAVAWEDGHGELRFPADPSQATEAQRKTVAALEEEHGLQKGALGLDDGAVGQQAAVAAAVEALLRRVGPQYCDAGCFRLDSVDFATVVSHDGQPIGNRADTGQGRWSNGRIGGREARHLVTFPLQGHGRVQLWATTHSYPDVLARLVPEEGEVVGQIQLLAEEQASLKSETGRYDDIDRAIERLDEMLF
jgi:hypothetical protein